MAEISCRGVLVYQELIICILACSLFKGLVWLICIGECWSLAGAFIKNNHHSHLGSYTR